MALQNTRFASQPQQNRTTRLPDAGKSCHGNSIIDGKSGPTPDCPTSVNCVLRSLLRSIPEAVSIPLFSAEVKVTDASLPERFDAEVDAIDSTKKMEFLRSV